MTSSALKSLVHEVSTRKIFAQAVDDAEGSSVGARIWTQCKDILITLLLLHAPNVRCLRFLDSSCRFWWADPVWLQAILRQAVSGDPPTILGNLSTVFTNASPHPHPLDHNQDLIRVPSVRRLELPSLYHWVSRNPVSAQCHLEATKRSVSFFLHCLFSSPPCFLDGDQTSHNSQHPDQGFRKFTTASISNLCRHTVTSVRLFYGD